MEKKVFTDNVNMETQTVFKTDGRIDIYPCDFELGKHIVSGHRKARQRGRMITDDDGTSHFLPFATNTGSPYEMLRQIANAKFMMSDGRLVLRISVPLTAADPYGELLQTFLDCVKPTRDIVCKISERKD